MSAYVTIIAALIGASAVLSGGLLVAWLNNKWAERTRKLDLYKQVYPEKVKAAQALMQAANELYQKTTSHAVAGDPTDKAIETELLDEATTLYSLSTSAEWILGAEVKMLGLELAIMTRKLFSTMHMARTNDNATGEETNDWVPATLELGGTGKYETVYRRLNDVVRKQLHLGTLDTLLPKE